MLVSDELETGSKLGPYRLLTQLGQGGMATVWAALEQSPQSGKQRVVAVKAMLPELAEHPEFRSMFLAEGQLVRSIQHPHVVRVHDVGEDRGILFMAMEWVEGDALHTLIREARRRRAVPPEAAVRILADVASGLHEAHELRGWDGELRGLVHSDVSPHNVLIGLDGQAKLVDFGVARAVAMSDVAPGTFMGKYSYLSPEQAMGLGIDRRSDLFSLGIVLFELTTGERLFRGRDAAHSLQLVCSGPIPRPTSIHHKYPKPLERIVLRALDRDPDRRYQTAEELRLALEGYLVEQRIVVSPAGVGSLLRRIMGARIAERRKYIEKAIEQLSLTKAPGSGRPSSSQLSPVSVRPPSVRTSPSAFQNPGPRLTPPGALGRVGSGLDTVSAPHNPPSQSPSVSPNSGTLSSTTQGSDSYFTDPSAALLEPGIDVDLEALIGRRSRRKGRSRILVWAVPVAAALLLGVVGLVRGGASWSLASSLAPAASLATDALSAQGGGHSPGESSGPASAPVAPGSAPADAVTRGLAPPATSALAHPAQVATAAVLDRSSKNPASPAEKPELKRKRRDGADLGIANPYR